MSPDDPRHGKRAGYYAHRRDGEQACTPCRRGAARAEQARQLAIINGTPLSRDALGSRRRLQALVALGYTAQSLADHLAVGRHYVNTITDGRIRRVYARTAVRIDDTYRRLHMTPPPTRTPTERTSATRARRRAARNGWAPPLAWDDIDDPDETPTGHQSAEQTWAAQEAARLADRLAAIQNAADEGHTLWRLSADLNIGVKGIHKWCVRHGHRDLYDTISARTRTSENGTTAGAA